MHTRHLQIVKIYGIVFAFLGLVGLIDSGRFLGMINVDPSLDFVRLALAAALTYAGLISKTEKAIRGSLIASGVVCILFAVLSLMSSTGGGLLPSGFTQLDLLLNLGGGIFALWVGIKNEDQLPARS